jgi:hypothetical protein
MVGCSWLRSHHKGTNRCLSWALYERLKTRISSRTERCHPAIWRRTRLWIWQDGQELANAVDRLRGIWSCPDVMHCVVSYLAWIPVGFVRSENASRILFRGVPLVMFFTLRIAMRAGVAGAEKDLMPYRSRLFLQSTSSPH